MTGGLRECIYASPRAAWSRARARSRHWRAGKLLLHKREIAKLWDATQRKGMTVVPLSIYFNDRGLAKAEIAIAEGKKHYDKREAQKTKDWNRQKQRLIRDLS